MPSTTLQQRLGGLSLRFSYRFLQQKSKEAASVTMVALILIAFLPSLGRADDLNSSYFDDITDTGLDPSTPGYEYGSDVASSHQAMTVEGASYNQDAPVNMATSVSSVVGMDYTSQFADLQNQIHSQNSQIAALQSELNTPANRRVAKGTHRWFSTYESVIVQPLQANTTAFIVETDLQYSHVPFAWELQHSPRVQFGLETLDDSLGWRLRYWQFRHNNTFDANDSNGLIPIGSVGIAAYLIEDGDISVGLDDIEEGTFNSHIRTDVIDLEVQRRVADPLDIYAGIRYAKLAQGYNAVTNQGSAMARSSFRGAGPTLAMRLQHDLGWKRLSLFANARGSLLFGHKEFSVTDDVSGFAQFIGNEEQRANPEGADALAGNSELQVGVRLTPTNWFSLTVAFEAQYFSNVGGANPTGVFTGPDRGLSGDSPIDDSLSFAGVTVGTEVTW